MMSKTASEKLQDVLGRLHYGGREAVLAFILQLADSKENPSGLGLVWGYKTAVSSYTL